MVTAAIYTRLSLAREDQTSTERQERDCRALCEARGAEVVAVYSDLLSGWNRNVRRPDYERYLADIARHAFDLAVIWKLDRLTRQGVREVARLLEALEKGGVRLVSVQDSIDTSTAMGEGILGLLASVARAESDAISLRVRSAKDYAARKGTPSGGGTRPFGYDVDRVTLIPAEALLIQEAAQRVLAGETFGSVCKDWEERDVRTPTGRHWQENQLRQMLRSPRLAGLREHRGEVVGPAVWPAVLDSKTARRVAALASFSGERGRSPRAYLLTNLVVCGRCQSALKPQRRYPSGVRSYICVRIPGFANCGGLRIQADPLEAHVSESVLAAIDGPDFAERRRKRSGDDTGSMLDDLARAEARLVELAEMWAAGEVTRAEWLAARRPLDAVAESVRRQLAGRASHAEADRSIAGAGLATEWGDLPLVRRRAVVTAVLERVVVNRTGRRGPHFDASRVELVWRL